MNGNSWKVNSWKVVVMTKREAAIVSAYTGIMLGKFSDMLGYIEEILGRPVHTHELTFVVKD